MPCQKTSNIELIAFIHLSTSNPDEKKANRITDSVQVPGRIEIVNDDMSFN